MTEYITKSAFAKQQGVGPSAVTLAIKCGRITPVLVGGREMIDPIAAAAQWAEYTRPRRKQAPRVTAHLRASSPSAGAERSLQVSSAEELWAARCPPPADSPPSSLHDVRIKRETHEANIAEMKEQQMAGALVDRERVRTAALRSGRLVRDSVLGVATRIAPDLVGQADLWEIQRLLEEALRQALDDAARLCGADLEGVLSDGR